MNTLSLRDFGVHLVLTSHRSMSMNDIKRMLETSIRYKEISKPEYTEIRLGCSFGYAAFVGVVCGLTVVVIRRSIIRIDTLDFVY